MRRSGTLSGMDYKQGLEKLESWAGEEDILEADESSGPRTAKGVAVMQALDDELREMTAGRYSLDDVAGQLSLAGAPVSIEQLRQVAELLAGQPLESISPQRIDTD
jgi:predicted metalloprotease with PDZ domain